MNHSEPVAAAIRQFLAQHSLNNHSFLVALSGGADSVALLHALCQHVPKDKVHAIYIDHQLQDVSVEWADFNQKFCHALGVKFHTLSVNVGKSASIEAEARHARYQALSKELKPLQYLLTGHHQDDQAETLLLQLFRGAGPKGLSAMPVLTDFAEGFHARPLLNVCKDDILQYCKKHDLAFVEDPSNQDLKHRRNFLRHQVMPLLEEEWPQVKSTLARASELQADAQSIVYGVAEEDFTNCSNGTGLSLDELSKLPKARQGQVLRYWLESLQQEMPSQKVLGELLEQMLNSESSAQPSIEFSKGAIKRSQGYLVWVSKNNTQSETFDIQPTSWDGMSDLVLSESLTITRQWLEANHPELQGKLLIVKSRQGGERFRKKNAKHSTSLKNYFQEHGVPSWQREQVVLILLNGEVRVTYQEHLN